MDLSQIPKDMMWAETNGNELYVFRNGELVYKRWYKRGSTAKRQPSLLFNKHWPNEWIA